MNHCLMPVIAKRPDYLILHVETNNATTNTSRKIIDDLLMLKWNILEQLPSCRVTFSKPTVRIDHGKANLTLRNVNKHLETLNLECIENGNISAQHLGRKGLHLNSKGKGRLAINFLNHIRKFWRPVEHLNEPLSSNNQSDEVEHKVSGKLESPPPEPIIDRNTNGICKLKQLRNQNPHRIIIGHLNINSIRNKFESLVRFVGKNLDILMVSETKIDVTFPEPQFLIEFFSKPFRLDRTVKCGWILLYIRGYIPCRYIKQITLNNLFKGFFLELNSRSKKWLLEWSYNHHKENIAFHLRKCCFLQTLCRLWRYNSTRWFLCWS